MNVDGFDISAAPRRRETSAIRRRDERKNCTVSTITPAAYVGDLATTPRADCAAPTSTATTRASGGGGASPTWRTTPTAATPRAPSPSPSRPGSLISPRQVTNLITNHTFSNLVLRPPSLRSTGFPRTSRRTARSAPMTADQRLRQLGRLPALRHVGLGRGLEILEHRRSRLHLRDRQRRLPPAVRDRRGRGVPRPAARRRCRQGRQPRGVLPDGRGHGRRRVPLTIPEAGGRRKLTASKTPTPAPRRLHPDQRIYPPERSVRDTSPQSTRPRATGVQLGGEPVDAAVGRRSLWPMIPPGAAAADREPDQPGATPGPVPRTPPDPCSHVIEGLPAIIYTATVHIQRPGQPLVDWDVDVFDFARSPRRQCSHRRRPRGCGARSPRAGHLHGQG